MALSTLHMRLGSEPDSELDLVLLVLLAVVGAGGENRGQRVIAGSSKDLQYKGLCYWALWGNACDPECAVLSRL